MQHDVTSFGSWRAIVLRDRAFVFVDGRYTLQVRAPRSISTSSPSEAIDNPPASWIYQKALAKGEIAPQLRSMAAHRGAKMKH